MNRTFIILFILVVLGAGIARWCINPSVNPPARADHPIDRFDTSKASGSPQEQTVPSLVAAYLAAPTDPARKRQMIQAINQVKGPADTVRGNEIMVAALISVISVNKYINDDQGPRGPVAVFSVSDLPPRSDLLPAVGALERIGASAGPQLIRDALGQDRENTNLKRGIEEGVIAKILPQSDIHRLIDQATTGGTPSVVDQGKWFKQTMDYYFSSSKQ